MISAPIAMLPADDPLYALLAGAVFARGLGIATAPQFEVYQLDPSATAFRYADRLSGVSVVGKFFGNKWIDGAQTGRDDLRAELLRREYNNLLRVRGLGLDTPPYQVVRPLALSQPINCVLIEEYVPGEDLTATIRAAAYHNAGDLLLARLDRLAGFLATLHHRSATGQPAAAGQALSYLDKLLGQLQSWNVIDAAQRSRLEHQRDGWAAAGLLGAAHAVLIHGDATPAHFLFGERGVVTAIDLERLRYADPAADLGCVAAELRHLLSWYRGDAWAGEPYIRHFYARYAAARGLGPAAFAALTERCRFYMGCTELRICRNSWLELDYRRAFVAEAERCLAI